MSRNFENPKLNSTKPRLVALSPSVALSIPGRKVMQQHPSVLKAVKGSNPGIKISLMKTKKSAAI